MLSAKSHKTLKVVFLTYLLFGLLYLPWIGPLIGHLVGAKESSMWVGQFSTFSESNPYNQLLWWAFNLKQNLLNSFYFLFLVYLAHRLYMGWKNNGLSIKQVTAYNPDVLLLLWLFTPLTVVYLVSVLYTPFLLFYPLIISMPAAYILVSHSIAGLPIKKYFKALLFCFFLCYLLENIICWGGYYTTQIDKPQFREAIYFALDEGSSMQESVILGCTYGPENFNEKQGKFNYYLNQRSSEKRVNAIVCEKEDIPKAFSEIRSTESSHFWYVWAEREPSTDVLEFFKQNMTLVKESSFHRAGAHLFQLNPDNT